MNAVLREAKAAATPGDQEKVWPLREREVNGWDGEEYWGTKLRYKFSKPRNTCTSLTVEDVGQSTMAPNLV